MEIKDMTNTELDKAIALEAMGRVSDLNLNLYWRPSSLISHAWQVVDKIKERFVIYITLERTSVVEVNIGRGMVGMKDFVDVEAEATTAPRAICEAALMAVRS